jgi:hypothetical protein
MISITIIQTMKEYIDTLNKWLVNIAPLVYLEKKTNIKKSTYLFGLMALMFYMSVGIHFMLKLFSTLYLVYRSRLILYSVDSVEHKELVIDWLIYGMFNIIELFTDYISFVIPFYGYIKMGILIWLFGSCTNGSHRIYKNYIEPYFKKYDFSKLNLSDIFGNVDINQVFFDKNKSINLNTIKNYIKTNFNVENLEIPSEIIDAIVNHNNKINQPPDQD